MDYCTSLRHDRFHAWCNSRGYTVATFADDLGAAPTSIYRLIRDETQPSSEFIAGCAVIFGQECLSDIFEFTTTSARQARSGTFAPTMRRRGPDPEPRLGA